MQIRAAMARARGPLSTKGSTARATTMKAISTASSRLRKRSPESRLSISIAGAPSGLRRRVEPGRAPQQDQHHQQQGRAERKLRDQEAGIVGDQPDQQ